MGDMFNGLLFIPVTPYRSDGGNREELARILAAGLAVLPTARTAA